MTDQNLLTRAEVIERTKLSVSSLYRLMRIGHFPEPIRIGQRAVRWRESDISDFIAGRPLARGIMGQPDAPQPAW